MSSLISTVIVVAGLVGVYYIIKGEQIPFLDDIFKQLGLGGLGGGGISGGGSVGVGAGIGGGNISAAKGSFMHKGTGKTWTAQDSGKTKRNYASGKSSTGTTQWDIKGVGAVSNIETDLWVNVGSCSDSVSTKVYGDGHSDGKCCWLILNVDCASGTFELGGEGPHPKTDSSNLGKGGSMGSIKNKEVGIKLVTYKSGAGFTAIGYGNTGSGWKEYIRKSFTQFGANKKASSPASDATIQFRTDCSGVKYSVARAQEIAAPSSSAAAYTNILWNNFNDGMQHEIIEGDRYVSYYTEQAGLPQPQNIFQKVIKAIDDITPGYIDDGIPDFLPVTY